MRNLQPAALYVALLASASVLGVAHADPAAGPSAIVTPLADLIDGDIVQVSGDGFNQDREITIFMCGGTTICAATGAEANSPNVVLNADAAGSFEPTDFTVSLVIETAVQGGKGHNGQGGGANKGGLGENILIPVTYNCLPENDCYIRVLSSTGKAEFVDLPISFAP